MAHRVYCSKVSLHMWLGSSIETECPHQGTAWDIDAGMGTDSSVVLKDSSMSIPGSSPLR